MGALSAGKVFSEEPTKRDRLPGSGQWDFHLLPKAFQKRPDLDMTVMTEFTPVGRLMRPASPTQPAYYQAQAGGFKQLGDTSDGEHPPPPAELQAALTKALAVNGFLTADLPGHPPTLAVFFSWGSHNKLDPETAAMFPQLAARHLLERSILVGGKNFASNQARLLEYGASILDRDEQMDYLRDQADTDLYFVVASAYDYQALAAGQRHLLWRTSMTVSSRGLSMGESLTPLIATAGPYFGRDMISPEIATRRISREREGHVEIGPLTVVNGDAVLRQEKPPPAKSEPLRNP